MLRGKTVGAPAPEHGPIVVGADGTPSSADAVQFALTTAAARGVDVVAVHAWTYEGLVDGWSPLPVTVDWDDIAVAQHRMFDEHLRQCVRHIRTSKCAACITAVGPWTGSSRRPRARSW